MWYVKNSSAICEEYKNDVGEVQRVTEGTLGLEFVKLYVVCEDIVKKSAESLEYS